MAEQGAFCALVLAGSRGEEDPVARAAGVEEKCLAPLLGKPMLAWVLESLEASRSVGRIAVVATRPDLLAMICAEHGAALIDAASAPAQSVLEAVEELDSPYPLLIVTADNPLLTPERVDVFCTAAAGKAADLAAGLTPSAAIKAAFPESRRTYLKFRDEHYSGANLFALTSQAGLAAVSYWRRVERERKKPWKVVGAFGLGSLIAFAFNRLTLDDAMARGSRKIGAKAVAIRLEEAEAAVDVDRPEDLILAERLLAERKQ